MGNKFFRATAILLLLVTLGCCLCACIEDAPQTPEQPDGGNGAQTADFTVYDINGAQVKLSDLFGKPIVVDFWATWCGPCKTEFPHFQRLYQQYGDDVVFMMVNTCWNSDVSTAHVKDFLQQEGYTFPVYFDTNQNATTVYKVEAIPFTLFINADGSIYDSHLGSMSGSALERLLQSIIK